MLYANVSKEEVISLPLQGGTAADYEKVMGLVVVLLWVVINI